MLSFHANKALPLLVLPIGASSLLLAAALKWRRWFLISAPLVILGCLSTPAIANHLLQSLEDRYPYRSLGERPYADAAFVFGGMIDPRDREDGSMAWNDAAERFDRSIRIMQTREAKILVFSGGSTRYGHGDTEGELMKREAMARGVPENTILVTPATTDTKSEAVDICRLAAAMKWKRILLITSAYHMPRAMLLTENCTAERLAVPVAYRTPDPNSSWAQSRVEFYLPQARALLNSELALREYLGMLLYSTGSLS